MPYRILILESLRDEISSRREAQMQQNPLLQGHEFQHMYLTEPTPMDQTMPMQVRMLQSQQRSMDEKALLGRLAERVDAFNADILIVHSGAVFHSYPDQMLFVMQSLKTSHPNLRIGFQTRAFEKYGIKPFFEYSSEMGELMARIFAEPVR